MPLAYELVLGYSASLSGTGLNALTAGANQSFTVRNFSTGQAVLEEVIGHDSVGAFRMQITSPKMHDTTYGLQFYSTPKTLGGTSVFNPVTLLPGVTNQPLYATDTLSWQAAGANADVVVGGLGIFYSDLSGIAARLYTWDHIRPLIVNLAGVQVSPVTSSTAGAWGTAVALNSGNYNLKANTDYAILGYQSQLPGGVIAFQGTDTGNLLIGGPVSTDSRNNGSYFVDKAIQYHGPRIPVFNSNNAPGMTVNIANSGTGTTVPVSLTVAQLSQLLPSPGAGTV
jgi:hypothetical protein